MHSLVDRETGGKSQEGRVIQSFFNLIERHEPQLVSWNGSGFDLPVLHTAACATASSPASTGTWATTIASTATTTTSAATTCAIST